MCWTTYIFPKVMAVIWHSYTGHKDVVFHYNLWGLKVMYTKQKHPTSKKKGKKKNKCFLGVVIIAGWAYWFDVGTIPGVCICVGAWAYIPTLILGLCSNCVWWGDILVFSEPGERKGHQRTSQCSRRPLSSCNVSF